MTLFKKRKNLITIVNNEDLSFVISDPPDEGKVIDSLALDQFLSVEMESHHVPEEARRRVNSLLIVPDYWFGNVTFKFQSRKKSIIEVFIERKLLAEYPDLPDIKYFFGYIPYNTAQREKELYVYFLQEPKFFQLYNQLVELNLSPQRITAPAFIWAQKLREVIPDFDHGGKAIIHVLPKECFLYFFFQGFFLFSRSIAFTNPQMESSEKLNTLTHEMNQSFYLFSQKAKAGVEQIYMASPEKGDVHELSAMLGREVKELMDSRENQPKEAVIARGISAVGRFKLRDLAPSKKFLSILHQLQRKELEWKPVQTVGIAVGLILLLLFGVEAVFLWKLSQPSLVPMAKAGIMTGKDPKYSIQEYNEALDFLIRESERPSPQDVIVKVARSLPEDFLIKEMTIATEENPAVHIKGVVTALGPDKLRNSISHFLGRLKKYFQGIQSLGLQDVDFEIDKTANTKQGYQTYLITFGFSLP